MFEKLLRNLAEINNKQLVGELVDAVQSIAKSLRHIATYGLPIPLQCVQCYQKTPCSKCSEPAVAPPKDYCYTCQRHIPATEEKIP